MSLHISIDNFFTRREEVPVIDVRSPSEYAQGHIPGAHNIPLFTDAERAAVGKEYKQRGAEFAVLKGLKYIRPKLKDFVRNAAEISDRSSLIVHCWRGGLRSVHQGYRGNQSSRRERFRTRQPAPFVVHHGRGLKGERCRRALTGPAPGTARQSKMSHW